MRESGLERSKRRKDKRLSEESRVSTNSPGGVRPPVAHRLRKPQQRATNVTSVPGTPERRKAGTQAARPGRRRKWFARRDAGGPARVPQVQRAQAAGRAGDEL